MIFDCTKVGNISHAQNSKRQPHDRKRISRLLGHCFSDLVESSIFTEFFRLMQNNFKQSTLFWLCHQTCELDSTLAERSIHYPIGYVHFFQMRCKIYSHILNLSDWTVFNLSALYDKKSGFGTSQEYEAFRSSFKNHVWKHRSSYHNTQ